jgi:hypothetical protein
MPGCFSVMLWLFLLTYFTFLLLFVTFFTPRKFYKLLFIPEKGKVCYFLLFFYCL